MIPRALALAPATGLCLAMNCVLLAFQPVAFPLAMAMAGLAILVLPLAGMFRRPNAVTVALLTTLSVYALDMIGSPASPAVAAIGPLVSGAGFLMAQLAWWGLDRSRPVEESVEVRRTRLTWITASALGIGALAAAGIELSTLRPGASVILLGIGVLGSILLLGTLSSVAIHAFRRGVDHGDQVRAGSMLSRPLRKASVLRLPLAGWIAIACLLLGVDGVVVANLLSTASFAQVSPALAATGSFAVAGTNIAAVLTIGLAVAGGIVTSVLVVATRALMSPEPTSSSSSLPVSDPPGIGDLRDLQKVCATEANAGWLGGELGSRLHGIERMLLATGTPVPPTAGSDGVAKLATAPRVRAATALNRRATVGPVPGTQPAGGGRPAIDAILSALERACGD